jgi:hypothetical protein
MAKEQLIYETKVGAFRTGEGKTGESISFGCPHLPLKKCTKNICFNWVPMKQDTDLFECKLNRKKD